MLHIAILVLLTHFALAQAPRYTIHDLGLLNEGPPGSDPFLRPASVTGINIRGQVIGWETQPDGHVRSFRTAPNSAINWAADDLGSLEGGNTWAYGINVHGQAVGSSLLTSHKIRAFRTAPNKRIQASTDDIGTLGLDESPLGTVARAINDSGQVTGQSDGQAFVTAPNSPINPATDGFRVKWDTYYPSIVGLYINSRGHVLSEFTPSYPTTAIFIGRETRLVGIGRAPSESYTGFTDQDQIVFNGYNLLHLWQDGTFMQLADCIVWCIPFTVNNSLQIVLNAETGPLLYTDGTLYDLNALIQNPSGWTLPRGPTSNLSWAMNDLGQLAGVGRLNNETHAFRLDPAPSAPQAIRQLRTMVRFLPLDRRSRMTLPLILKAALASKLTAALQAWNRGSPAATRGFLNEFENIVRANTGVALSKEQADQLLDMAEAAIAMT